MATPEKAIETSILRYLNTLPGGFFWKNNQTGVWDPKRKVFRKSKNIYAINGVADILGCYHGKFIAIEVKSEKGRLSDSQKRFIENIEKVGGIAFVARGAKEAAEKIKNIQAGGG